MQRVSKPLAKISAGTQEAVKLSSGTKYCLFFSNPNVKALNNNCLGRKIALQSISKCEFMFLF